MPHKFNKIYGQRCLISLMMFVCCSVLKPLKLHQSPRNTHAQLDGGTRRSQPCARFRLHPIKYVSIFCTKP